MAPKKAVERGVWSVDEHDKFLAALKVHPRGPWRIIAAQVGTRSARQVQTHAQKYYEKVARRMRGLRKDRKKLMRPEHRLDEEMMQLCQVGEREGSQLLPLSSASVQQTWLASTPTLDVSCPYDTAPLSSARDKVAPRANSTAPTEPSFTSLLLSGEHEPIALDRDASDSDDLDSLGDVDDYYLDFLIEALSAADDCASSDGSASD